MLSLLEACMLANTPKFLYENGLAACSNLELIADFDKELSHFINENYRQDQWIEAYELFFRLVISNRPAVLKHVQEIEKKDLRWIREVCHCLTALDINHTGEF